MVRGEALDEQLRRRAADLFYAEGISTTGMDRVADVTGVTKKTIYRRYPSKDALVAAALDLVSDERLAHLLGGADGVEDPVARLTAVFDGVAAAARQPGFLGCPYLRAAAEAPAPHPVAAVAHRHKVDTRAWFTSTAAEAGARDPALLGAQLATLLDGVLAQVTVLDPDEVTGPARAAAQALVALATGSGTTR